MSDISNTDSEVASEPEKTVVVINDEPTALMALKKVVSREYEVHGFQDPKLAWDFLTSETPPDLVLTDLYMPEIDGITLTRLLKRHSGGARGFTAPIVLTSAVAAGEDTEELALEVGASSFLALPQRPNALLDHLRSVLSIGGRRNYTRLIIICSETAKPLIDHLLPLLEEAGFLVEVRVGLSQSLSDDSLADVFLYTEDLDAEKLRDTLVRLNTPGRISIQIVLSLVKSASRAQELMEYGADVVLNESFQPDELFRTIRLARRQRAWMRVMETRHKSLQETKSVTEI